MDLLMLFCFLFNNNFKNAYTIGTIVFLPVVPSIALNNYICDCDYNFMWLQFQCRKACCDILFLLIVVFILCQFMNIFYISATQISASISLMCKNPLFPPTVSTWAVFLLLQYVFLLLLMMILFNNEIQQNRVGWTLLMWLQAIV